MKYDRELLKTVHGSHEGIDKQVYTKPSQKRRLERKRKKENARKAERQRKKKLDIS